MRNSASMTKAMYRIGYAARWSITIMMAISLLGCSSWPGGKSSSATKSGTVKYVIESDASSTMTTKWPKVLPKAMLHL